MADEKGTDARPLERRKVMAVHKLLLMVRSEKKGGRVSNDALKTHFWSVQATAVVQKQG
jgi:hypothetical protein